MAPHLNGGSVKNFPATCPPFDDEDADIIFRSSDDVDFRLYKVVLTKISPVFRTMLSTSTVPSGPGEPHVITLKENARTLEDIFRLCYPAEHPNVTSVYEVKSILAAAQKYEIASAIANLRWVITRILPEDPLRFYAIAYTLKMEDVTKKAAQLLLDDPQFHVPRLPPPEFNDLPCVAIYLVHTYRQNCVEAALHVLTDQELSSQSWIRTTFPKVGHYREDKHEYKTIHIGPKQVSVCKWFEVYFNSLKPALTERPSGRTVRSFPTSAGASAALSEAASCSNCASRAHLDAARFLEWLVSKVDYAVSKVSLNQLSGLCFCVVCTVG